MKKQILKCENLTKTYANGFQALNLDQLIIEEGDFYALLGANGAGKSTLLGIISSLVKKTSGSVEVFGKNIETHLPEIKQMLGIVPQEFNFNQFLTPKSILVRNAGLYGVGAKEAEEYGDFLLHKLDLFNKKYTQIRNLSGGMKRRVMIARALIHRPKLLLLDEPTAGVDVELRHQMWDFLQGINQQGTNIILTTHYLEEAENLCNKIGIIDAGKLVLQSDASQLLQQLNRQTLILTLANPVRQMPEIQDFSYKTIADADNKIEISFAKDISFNQLFAQLDKAGIQVVGVQNKHSLLEELFFELTQNKTNAKLIA